MKNMHRIPAILIGTACILCMDAALADARTEAYSEPGDLHINASIGSSGDSQIYVDGDEVVITARDHSKARISPNGDLSIAGKSVVVTDDERKLLRRYSLGARDIQTRGLQIGRDAINMVGGIMGTVVADLFTDGDDKDQIDRDARRQAEPLKQEARALCKDVQSERKVQAALVAELPAFQPYAVIDTKSEHDCHVDDNDIEV